MLYNKYLYRMSIVFGNYVNNSKVCAKFKFTDKSRALKTDSELMQATLQSIFYDISVHLISNLFLNY